MSALHTPGPWAVSKQKARRVTARGVIICNAVLRNRGGPKHKTELKDEHEAEANAALIAAGPDQNAALHNAVEFLQFYFVGPNAEHNRSVEGHRNMLAEAKKAFEVGAAALAKAGVA